MDKVFIQAKHWLDPPHFPDDEEKTSQARAMNTLGLYFVLMLVVAAVVYVPLLARYKVESWAIILILLVAYAIARSFLFRGQLTSAGLMVIGSGWLICQGLILVGGGIHSPAMFALSAATLVVGLLFHRRLGIVFLTLSILTALGFAGFQQSGVVLRQVFVYSPLSVWFFFALSLVFINWTMRFIVREFQNALELAQRQNTAREKAEATLRESEAKYRLLFDNAGDAIFIHDIHGHIQAANLLAMERLGYTRAELLSMTVAQVDSPEEGRYAPERIERLMQQGHYRFETVHRCKDGSLIPTEVSARALTWEGKPAMLSICRDISERKRAENDATTQRNLAEALSNSAAALNSSLKFEDVLDRILDNVGRVVHHDSVGVILLDAGRQRAQVVGYRDNRSRPVDMKGTEFSILQTRNLHEMQATGAPVIIPDTTMYAGWCSASLTAWIRSNLGAPITVKGEVIGFLCLDSATPQAFTALDATRLQAFIDHAAIAIENARLYEEVQKLALTDTLTGVFNRAFFEAELARVALSRDFPVSMIIADLDNLKVTNDRLGHPAGDELLKHTVRLLQTVFRASDVIARIGGDEFAVLLPNTDAATASQILERIRIRLAEYNLNHPGLPIKISLGVSTAECGPLMDAYRLADQYMYLEKAEHKSKIMN